jgi:hypothetical protein
VNDSELEVLKDLVILTETIRGYFDDISSIILSCEKDPTRRFMAAQELNSTALMDMIELQLMLTMLSYPLASPGLSATALHLAERKQQSQDRHRQKEKERQTRRRNDAGGQQPED